MKHIAGLTILGAFAAGSANAQVVSLDWISDEIAGTSISADGSVIAGNVIYDASFETFRWEDGAGQYVRLGRATFPAIGVAAGTPNVSADGTKISGSVLSTDGTLKTFGLWTLGTGWQTEDTVPMAPDNQVLDFATASTWGLSGDGNVVTGFYWSTGSALAQPAHWSPSGGAMALPLTAAGQNARVNCANYDGTVFGGWSEANNGIWVPTIWMNGTATKIETSTDILSMVEALSDDGTVAVGSSYDPATGQKVATRWEYDGAQWNKEILGYLPGTALGAGHSEAYGVSGDGSVVVGFNTFFSYMGPYSDATGFIWTEETGMQNIETDILGPAGLSVPEEFSIFTLTDVSADGTSFVGVATLNLDPYLNGTFRVQITPECFADCDGSGTLNVDDIDCYVAAFLGGDLARADCDNNGLLNIDDVDCFVVSFLGGCP